MFNALNGGFELSQADQQLLNEQRSLTKQINDTFIQVGAVYLKAVSKNPVDEHWAKQQRGDTNLQDWIDSEAHQDNNVGFNLQQGWVDIDIDASDPEFNRCILAGLRALRVDTRFAFGRREVGTPTHILVQLGDDEAQNFAELKRFEPKEFRIKDKRYHVQLRSMPTNIKAENVVKEAKQTVMPGSIYLSKTSPNQADLSVWYGKNGKVAHSLASITATTASKCNFNELVRGICFGVFLYIVRQHWVEGSRQTTAQKITGWLARVVRDSEAMNNHEQISVDVFCPIDCDDYAERLLRFVCEEMGDDESHMRLRAFYDASEKLERNPDAKIPGWPAMEQLLGGAEAAALRTVFMPGSDVSILTKMAERYLYDETDNRYLDRTRFFTSGNFVHEGGDLERRHKGDTIRVGGKPKEAFRIFESSDLRTRVGARDMYPELVPGGVYRISWLGEVLSDDDDVDRTSLTVFNTWRGWSVQPTATIDKELMEKCVHYLDRVLNWLTRDSPAQADWIKKWFAWTIQHPGDKQQIAWVVVGGQGVGKSFIGNVFAPALFGNLWGSASPSVIDQQFNIGPFKDKMFVFIDEAKFHGESGTDEIKKLIRNVQVPGMEKFQEARNYHIYSRIMFASNRFDMNIGQSNVRDRALFYTKAYDKDHTGQTETEFRAWTETLKPFFEEFAQLLKRRDAREHFMRYFMDLQTTRYEVESITLSSSNDPTIVNSNMSWSRRIAKSIIEEGRIFEDLDISYPFAVADLNKKVNEMAQEMGLRGMQGSHVLREFQEAGVVEKVTIGPRVLMRFIHKIGTLHDAFGQSIGIEMEPRYIFGEEHMGKNTCDGSTRPVWLGSREGVVARNKF